MVTFDDDETKQSESYTIIIPDCLIDEDKLARRLAAIFEVEPGTVQFTWFNDKYYIENAPRKTLEKHELERLRL